MATGAKDPYWEQQMLPSVLKHDLLRRYLPRFAGKIGSISKEIVYLDGYAGRGRYTDGTAASAERILQAAENQARLQIRYHLYFYESDEASFAVLDQVVDEYRQRGIDAVAVRTEVLGELGRIIAAARNQPLFLFFDPCGLGIPFETLASSLTGPRAQSWPPTEVLLNFSLEAVRRIAGHVTSATPNEATMARLDDALGGQWWRDLVRPGLTDDAVSDIVDGYMRRLADATKMQFFAIPVRRAPTHKPVYYLVFGTRSSLGIWHFADDAARATETWWETLDAQDAARQEAEDTLFPELFVPTYIRPSLAEVEVEALPRVARNLLALVRERGTTIRVGDFPAEVFGSYLGRVRETVVRAAIKDLFNKGLTASDGKGNRIADLRVSPPLGLSAASDPT